MNCNDVAEGSGNFLPSAMPTLHLNPNTDSDTCTDIKCNKKIQICVKPLNYMILNDSVIFFHLIPSSQLTE